MTATDAHHQLFGFLSSIQDDIAHVRSLLDGVDSESDAAWLYVEVLNAGRDVEALAEKVWDLHGDLRRSS